MVTIIAVMCKALSCIIPSNGKCSLQNDIRWLPTKFLIIMVKFSALVSIGTYASTWTFNKTCWWYCELINNAHKEISNNLKHISIFLGKVLIFNTHSYFLANQNITTNWKHQIEKRQINFLNLIFEINH